MAHGVLRLSFACCCSLVAFVVVATTDAATKSEKRRLADEYVAEALHGEIYGQNALRDKLLRSAIALSSECQAARWHSAQVQYNRDWVAINDVEKIAAKDRNLTRYQLRREKMEGTIAANLALAQWCLARGMKDQARAHLTRVVQLEPNHEVARRLLGFVRAGGVWVTRAEIVDAQRRADAARQDLERWRSKLEDVRDNFTTGSRKQREFAANTIRDIDDKSAIPAMEAVLSAGGEQLAILVVEALHNIVSSEASMSLARHAVYSAHESVRTAASKSLRDRTKAEFIPPMLAVMEIRIQLQRDLLEDQKGRLLFRHSVLREGRDRREVTVLETTYERTENDRAGSKRRIERAKDDIDTRSQVIEQEVAARNQRTAALNQRIMTALAIATRVDMLNTPTNWWQWWNDYNGVYVPSEKPIASSVRSDVVSLSEADELTAALIAMSGGLDCLAAGTIVWTELGPRAIEAIKVGDRVLSKDPKTGELAYKPVLATTVRPASVLTEVVIGDEVVQCSGGHVFWSSGDGWRRAREIKSGTALHGAGKASEVNYVALGSKLPTYNLVVGDFHTYFVGKSRILSHDNTMRQPTHSVVPGLTAE